jgi:membrane glycosyltransferase
VLSIPLAMLLGSVDIGKSLARKGLLTTTEEVIPPPVLKYRRDALAVKRPGAQTAFDRADVFALVFKDPAFYALNVGILRATESHVPISPQQLQQAKQLMSTDAMATAPAEFRRAVLSDWRTMESLHILVRSHLPPVHSVLLT